MFPLLLKKGKCHTLKWEVHARNYDVLNDRYLADYDEFNTDPVGARFDEVVVPRMKVISHIKLMYVSTANPVGAFACSGCSSHALFTTDSSFHSS